MVRNIVERCSTCSANRIRRRPWPGVLERGDRRFAGATAPAAGLYLWRVEYPGGVFGIPAPDHRLFAAADGLIGLKLAHVLVRANCPVAYQKPSVAPALGAGRLVDQVPRPAMAVLYRAEIEAQSARMPEVQPPYADQRPRAAREVYLDTGSTTELAAKVEPEDPLKIQGFEALQGPASPSPEADRRTRRADRDGRGKLAGPGCRRVARFEFRFLGGSMGSVVGEKFVAARVEHCLEHRMPLVCFRGERAVAAHCRKRCIRCCRMAKTSGPPLKRPVGRRGLPFISVMNRSDHRRCVSREPCDCWGYQHR